jgi:hypothetical protein
LLGGIYGQKSIRTGFFLISLISLNCNLFMSEQFSRNNRVQAWCVCFYSCHCNCFLTAWSSSLRVGGRGGVSEGPPDASVAHPKISISISSCFSVCEESAHANCRRWQRRHRRRRWRRWRRKAVTDET